MAGKRKVVGPGKFDMVELAVATKALSVLQKSGVPILDSMEIAVSATTDKKTRKAFLDARPKMREGLGIAGPMKDSGFPAMYVQMVAAGEETGKLDEMLEKIGDYYAMEARLPAKRSRDSLISLFCRQMATMVSTGLPLVTAIGIIAENMDDKVIKAALLKLQNDVSLGINFSDAMAAQKGVFSPILISVSRAGETGGCLDVVLDRLASLLEWADVTRRSVSK